MTLNPAQKVCVETLDCPLVVCAGAGSGKTLVLTKRIVHALQTGFIHDINEVLAITFTERAAAELKSRVKRELRACGLIDQALKVDEAWISTIHGACARLLRAHALELGIDPAFTVLDESVLRTYRAQAIDYVLDEAQSEEGAKPFTSAALDALFAEYRPRAYQGGQSSSSFRGTSVEGMLESLMEAASSSPDGIDGLVLPSKDVDFAPSIPSMVEHVRSEVEDLVECARSQKPGKRRDGWLDEVESVLEIIAAKDNQTLCSSPLDALELLFRIPLCPYFGQSAFKERRAQVNGLIHETILRIQLILGTSHLQTLVELARKAQRRFASSKACAGGLDNNDLIMMAADALQNFPALAQRYQDAFKLIMVDEFQDTDAVQVALIKQLAGPAALRLCTVGDPQQSIYRFRGADVTVFYQHKNQVLKSEAGQVISLSANYRSHSDVLAFVDQIFAQDSMFGCDFMSLEHGRKESETASYGCDLPRITAQFTTLSFANRNSIRLRKAAAEGIANQFAKRVEQGHSPAEMVILLGSMTHSDLYAQALRDVGLSCVIAGGSVFADTMEAGVIQDLLDVAANPHDTEALFNVLSSPLFQLDTADFVQLGTRKETSSDVVRRQSIDQGLFQVYQAESQGAQDKNYSLQLVCAARVLHTFLEKCGVVSTAHLLKDVLVDSGWIARLEEQGSEGQASAANLYKALRLVDDLEARLALGPATLSHAFARALKCGKEAPGALSASDDKFVRIMTIHASKGLQFPLVAVAEIAPTRIQTKKLALATLNGRVVPSLDIDQTVTALDGSTRLSSHALNDVYENLTEEDVTEDDLASRALNTSDPLTRRAALIRHQRQGDDAEAKRLLYVALTRAQEAVLVSATGYRTKTHPNGEVKGVLAQVFQGLCGSEFSEEGLGPGVHRFEFGGQQPARVDCCWADRQVEKEKEQSEPEKLRAVPSCQTTCSPDDAVFSEYHTDLFSYSSVAEAAKPDGLLNKLACSFGVGYSKTLRSESSALDDAGSGTSTFFFGDDDEAFWEALNARLADSDKATALGTAFHRLAQYAVCAHTPGAPLACPSQERIKAQVRRCRLDAVQQVRLSQALNRWFKSSLAAFMAARSNLRAEVPFFVALDEEVGSAHTPFSQASFQQSTPSETRCSDSSFSDTTSSHISSPHNPSSNPPSSDTTSSYAPSPYSSSSNTSPLKTIPAPSSSLHNPLYLEGEIDLLAYEGKTAFVVDYKTGGQADETGSDLLCKHVLQASTYALALLRTGVSQVEATFVRVEQEQVDNPQEPQYVQYCFTKADQPVLEKTLRDLHVQSQTESCAKNLEV